MHIKPSLNVRKSKLPLRTFGIFGIVLLLAIAVTWWITRSYYQQNSANERTISSLNSSLINCNNLIQNMNSAILYEMDEKLNDPARKEKALIWNPKAKSALRLTQNIQHYVQELKGEITGTISYKRFGSEKTFYKPYISEGLFDSLNNFNNYLTDLIPHERIGQLGILPVQSLTSGAQTKDKEEWYERNFENLDNNATLAILSKIESEILRSTNIVLNYINNQTEKLIHHNEFYMPLISQNSMILSPGERLEITAGLGVYSSMTNPKIQINHINIPINDYGVGVYKQTVRNEKEGSVLVSISYRDPNTGYYLTSTKSIEYTVFQSAKK